MRVRLDQLLVSRGLAASRERAQAMILAARVAVGWVNEADLAPPPAEEQWHVQRLGLPGVGWTLFLRSEELGD